MMALDLIALSNNMLSAAKEVLIESWDDIQPLAEANFLVLAEGITNIEQKFLQGDISEEKAKKLLRMKKNSLEIAMLTVEGLSLIAVEQAINAALNIAKDAVNSAINFTLI
jgi:hypothetical protein